MVFSRFGSGRQSRQLTGAVQHKSQLQDDAGKLSVGRAGGQIKARLEASFYRQFRKQRLALWAAGRGPAPSFTAMVFEPCERSTKASCKTTQASWQLAEQEGK